MLIVEGTLGDLSPNSSQTHVAGRHAQQVLGAAQVLADLNLGQKLLKEVVLGVFCELEVNYIHCEDFKYFSQPVCEVFDEVGVRFHTLGALLVVHLIVKVEPG